MRACWWGSAQRLRRRGPYGSAPVAWQLLGSTSEAKAGLRAQEELLPVPGALFEGSLLLGGLARGVLGGAASSGAAPTLVHPALISGWCGLVATALNLLPVGSLDGGRIIQARRAPSS